MSPKKEKHVASQGGRPVDSPERLRALLLEAKARKAELLEQARKYEESHKLERFEPHVRQQLFFDALRDSALTTYVLLGGNRSGKTECAVAAAVSLALGRLPWVPLPKPVHLPPPLKAAVHPDGGSGAAGEGWATGEAGRPARAKGHDATADRPRAPADPTGRSR